jgi:hypothetical protein
MTMRRDFMGFLDPSWLERLRAFGSWVSSDFNGAPCYLVGSVLLTPGWNDVDVRLLLPDENYRCRFGGPLDRRSSVAWLTACGSYSETGKVMTGLPVDFQIQQQTFAECCFHGPREILSAQRHNSAAR